MSIFWRKLRRLNWRIRWLLASTGLMTIVTLGVYYWVPLATDISHFWGSVFVSWVGGVGLFWALGLFVAIASMVHPESESLESRVKILLRGQYGPELEVAKKLIVNALRPYLISETSRFIVQQYDEDNKLFRIQKVQYSEMKTLLPETSPILASVFRYENGTSAPKDSDQNVIHYLRVDGNNLAFELPFDTEFSVPFIADNTDEKTIVVEKAFTTWAREDEHHTHRPRRFVLRTFLEFENLLITPITVNMLTSNGRQDSVVQPGQKVVVGTFAELDDRELAYDLTISRVFQH